MRKSFWDKVKSVAKTVGKEGVKLALILYYCWPGRTIRLYGRRRLQQVLCSILFHLLTLFLISFPGIGLFRRSCRNGLGNSGSCSTHKNKSIVIVPRNGSSNRFRPESFPEPVDGDEKITEHTNGDTLEEKVFWDKIKSAAKGVGRGGIKLALILYYCYLDNKNNST